MTASRPPPGAPPSAPRVPPLVPRRFAWRGRVPVRALFFAAALPDGPARALAAWCAGARLFALEGGLLLVWAAPEPLDVRAAAGEPFVDVDGALSAAPLTSRERERVARGDVVRPVGGRLVTTRLAALPEVPAGALVDVSALLVLDAVSLGAPAPVVLPAAPPARPSSERARLLGDDAPNAAREAAARALRGEAVAAGGDGADGVDGAGDAQGALRRAQARAAQGVPAAGAGEAMLRAVVRALEATGLMDRMRAAHRRYVEDTLDLLRKGSLDDALKRAVPLAPPGAGPRPTRPAVALPTMRAGLDIGRGPRGPASSSIVVEDDLYTRMRASYRDAARQLEKDGRHREAAFVHIELLGEPHEGIAALERSGDVALWRLAAELAESHELGADRAVVLWLRAGDKERAIALARRHRAFATAVAALERSRDDAHAFLLRRAWAEHLARTAQYASAVDVLWPLARVGAARAPAAPGSADAASDARVGFARERLAGLLDAGVEAGGADVPSLVARRLLLDVAPAPEASSEQRPAPRDLARLQALVDDDGPHAASARTQLAYALGDAPASLRPATASLVRALCADAAAGAQVNLKLLGERLGDAALRADLPPQPARPVRRAPAEVLVLTGAPGAGGAVDVALLPDGRLVVARDEAGALVVTRKGGVASRSAEPCAQIVLHDNGGRALLVARRGGFARLARYDVTSGASAHWLDVRATQVASDTDGDVLFLARESAGAHEVIALDAVPAEPEPRAPAGAAARSARVLWQSAVAGPVLALARDATTLAVLHAAADGGARVATFDGRTLARRDEWAAAAPAELQAVNPRGDVVGLGWAGAVDVTPAGAFALPVPAGATPTAPLAVARDLAAASFEGEEGCGVVAHARGSDRLVMLLDGARVAALRAQGAHLVVVDTRGRAFVVDVARGALVQRVALP